MHIALVNTPIWDPATPPIGIAYLAAAVRQAGFQASIFDFNIEVWHALKNIKIEGGVPCFDDKHAHYFFNGNLFNSKILPHLSDCIEKFLDKICEQRPDVIGFSIRYTSYPCTHLLALKCKERLPNVKIIIGGPHASVAHLDIIKHEMQFSPIDVAVMGEGEATLVELLQRWRDGEPLAGCKGIVFRGSNGEIAHEPMRDQLPINELPIPKYEDFDLGRYALPGGMPVALSRGCVAKCTFCSETRFWQKYRYREARDVFQEIDSHVRRYGAKEILFADSLVNGNFKVLSELVDLLIESGHKLQWSGFSRVEDRMTKDLLERMARSGCSYLMFGFESGSQKVVDLMGKRAKVETARRVFRDAHEAGIRSRVCVIVGFPGEEEEDFEQTIDFLEENADYLDCVFTNQMNLIRGIPVYEEPGRFGVATDKPFEVHDWETEDGRNVPAVRLARLARLQEVVTRHKLWPAERTF